MVNENRGFIIKFKQIRNSCNNRSIDLNSLSSYDDAPPPIITAIQDSWSPTWTSQSSANPMYRNHITSFLSNELSSSCSHYLHTYSGSIRSPAFPFPYPTNQLCMYLFRRPAATVCKLRLKLKTFDVDAGHRSPLVSTSRNRNRSADCRFGDHLELPDGSRLCGRLPADTYIIKYSDTSNFLPIHFRSDASTGGIGFDIEFEHVANSCEEQHPLTAANCDQHVRSETRITSPGYPSQYSPNRMCVFTFERLSGAICKISLRFHRFALENGRDERGLCIKDFVQLPNGLRLCGNLSTSGRFNWCI